MTSRYNSLTIETPNWFSLIEQYAQYFVRSMADLSPILYCNQQNQYHQTSTLKIVTGRVFLVTLDRKAKDVALKSAGIARHKFPLDNEICIKTKITKCKEHGALGQSFSFRENIQMDHVGGQNSMTPKITR